MRISKPGGTKYKAWNITTKRVFKAAMKKGKKYRFQVAAVKRRRARAGDHDPVQRQVTAWIRRNILSHSAPLSPS